MLLLLQDSPSSLGCRHVLSRPSRGGLRGGVVQAVGRWRWSYGSVPVTRGCAGPVLCWRTGQLGEEVLGEVRGIVRGSCVVGRKSWGPVLLVLALDLLVLLLLHYALLLRNHVLLLLHHSLLLHNILLLLVLRVLLGLLLLLLLLWLLGLLGLSLLLLHNRFIQR